MLPMARRKPQFGIVDIWSYDFLKPALSVLISEEIDERIINMCAVRSKEAGSGTEFVKEKEFVLSS